jgi:hypothetical protein
MHASEQRVADYLGKKGCRLLRRGWPDFLCISADGTISAMLATSEQRAMHAALSRAGIHTSVIAAEEIDEGELDLPTLQGLGAA